MPLRRARPDLWEPWGVTPTATWPHAATILRLFGFDHTRLTYRYAGRDFRLTDVAGEVVREILA